MKKALDGPIAYLTGEYPRATDTFIQREIAALRSLGVSVLPCSIRRTGSEHHVGEEQLGEVAHCFYVQELAKRPWRLLSAHASFLARAPLRWFSALGLAVRTSSPGMKALLYQLFYFAEAAVIAEHLRSRGVLHLHNHFGNSSCTVAMLASALSGIPFSFTMHGPALFFEPMRWRIDVKIARAAFVACISHFARSQGMIFADPVHWPKMRIVHCGVRTALFKGAVARKPTKRLLFVGRLSPVKGTEILLEALSEVRSDHPEAHLTLIGDGSERPRLESLAERLGVREAVTFAGYRSQAEVAHQLCETDVLVLPSFAEGVPVVLMEAMASRVPVVATRVGGVAELVKDGVCGFMVPPGCPAALARRISELLSNPSQRRRMGAAGRAIVEAEFESEKEAAWMLRLFHGAVAGRLPEGLRPNTSLTLGGPLHLFQRSEDSAAT